MLYRREVADSIKKLAGGLDAATEALIDKAHGIRLLQIIDITGSFRALPEDVARNVADDNALLTASIVSGQARIYAYPPDLDAIKVLMDRVMGKVPTIVELDVKQRLEQTQHDHATLARVIKEHVPDEYLTPVVAELERIARRRVREEAAAAV